MSDISIGLMSGTSRDGVDAAAVDFAESPPALIGTHSVPYPLTLRHDVQSVSEGSRDRLDDVMALSVSLAKAYAACANALIEKIGVKPRVIGSHGQTVRHRPESGFTVQLGSGAIIAEMTGVPTVTDFRAMDIALGGEGAPLVPAFHQAVFSAPGERRAIVNIGGIANVTLLLADVAPRGFDTGPGNTLLDHWFRAHRDGDWDHKGQWSAQGQIIQPLLEAMLSDGYFRRAAPKSTGLEYFNMEWLSACLAGDEAPADVQATLRALTARSILRGIQDNATGVEAIYVCGGGAQNTALMQEIQSVASGYAVSTTGSLGIDPQWVEASAFAWLAHQRLEEKPGNLPSVTGAKRPAILGALYLP